jgi:hypothetical protein
MKNLTTSLVLARKIKRTHKSMSQLIKKYKDILEELGDLKEETNKTMGRPCCAYLINMHQVKFLITLTHGGDVAELKKLIVKNDFSIEKFNAIEYEYEYITYLYIVKNLSGFYKIGISKNPKLRIRNISTQTGQNIETIYISDKLFNGNNIESSIHNLYANKRKLGEWFELDQNDIKNIKNRVQLATITSHQITMNIGDD